MAVEFLESKTEQSRRTCILDADCSMLMGTLHHVSLLIPSQETGLLLMCFESPKAPFTAGCNVTDGNKVKQAIRVEGKYGFNHGAKENRAV